ncbi:MAG: hypothetical protein H7840_10925 [Alphaproteobacteria bacterium]
MSTRASAIRRGAFVQGHNAIVGHGRVVGHRLVVALVVASVLISCGPRRRDLDSMVWSKPGWDPQQEDRDLAACSKRGEKAAFRKHFWQRSSIAMEIENPTPATDPGALTDKLRRISVMEKISAAELTEECMNELGYEFVPVNRAHR